MRFKVVPEPRPQSFIETATRTLPLVPSSEDDCCGLLMADTDIDSRDVAREWITFLRALGQVKETDGKYYQRRTPVDDVAVAFRERVYATETVLQTVEESEEPLAATDVFERVRTEIPQWERNRRQDWEEVWHERVRRLLEWAVEFDLIARTADGYHN
ncbi:hypothetical protein [Halocatena pleomorpha]|uniref:Uncharacterized protein n=1 Tax=Halocatena pleomorpha TaxID=1785090 RepID=A0A3P3RCU7_9EURY|nr:hypothetical protein [Halocatena pleomorpha]RRJ30283.1 hypothetical protein EIK79_10190 [Halocatena pleomorpha]